MIIAKTPLRISLFGGSTDYESFYKEHGSFLIGTTIDKYSYLSMRFRPRILSNEHLIVYSKMDYSKDFEGIQNPLIRETLRYGGVKDFIELFSFADIPSRTGLGGSSSYCVGLLYLIDQLYGRTSDKKKLVNDAITVERKILKETGGIQDQIWPAYGGLNSIEINTAGKYSVKPMPVSEDFRKELEDSMVLIYTNEQRNQNEIAEAHENKDKKQILQLSRQAYTAFVQEDIKTIGQLLHSSWKEKRAIDPRLISSQKVDDAIAQIMLNGAYGAKLLGTGGCGFILAICNSHAKERLSSIYGDFVLPFKFESDGVRRIYS